MQLLLHRCLINLMENITEQIEEIEVLSAIYGHDFQVVDEAKRIYKIHVPHRYDSWRSVTLRVVLPPEYPSKTHPVFEIHSTWMGEADKIEMSDLLYRISHDHQGEIVLYQWVEALRTFIDNKFGHQGEGVVPPPSSHLGKKEHLSVTFPVDVNKRDNEESAICDIALESLAVVDPEDNAFKHLQVSESEEKPEIIHGEPFTDRKSTFQAHVAHVITKEQVKQVMEELRQNRKISNAAHNVMAYRIFCEDRKSFLQDCNDDGEALAGGKLLHLLQIVQARNVVVVVTRWYGGTLLGPDRFKHYNNCARDVMKMAGFVDTSNPNNMKESKSKSRFKSGKKH